MLDETVKLGPMLWVGSVAGATSGAARLVECECVMWKYLAAPFPASVGIATGSVGLTSAPREGTGVLLLRTGHTDNRSARRLFVPGTPAAWSVGGLLTDTGKRALEGLGHRMIMGMLGAVLGGPLVWLLHYTDAVEPQIGNERGVAFRRVESVDVCWHTERAPAPSGQPFP